MFKRLYENYLYSRVDLEKNTGFDLLDKPINQLSSTRFRNLESTDGKDYLAYGMKHHKLWKLIYVKKRYVVETYFDRRGISNEDFSFLQKCHIRRALDIGLHNTNDKNYTIYESDKYQLVITEDRIICRNLINKV